MINNLKEIDGSLQRVDLLGIQVDFLVVGFFWVQVDFPTLSCRHPLITDTIRYKKQKLRLPK